jgi:DNA-binding CsgD family transcriptional regulator/PAS domain-containing protein
MSRQTDIAGALECLADAPYDEEQWQQALRLLATATGGIFSQLVGWTKPSQLPLNMTWNAQAGMLERWLASGGTDPSINPVVRAGLRTPDLHLVSDDEIVSLDDRKQLPIWQEFYEPYDMPHLCFTPIWRDGIDPRCHLMLVVCRNRRAGVINPDDRAAFTEIARHWRQASLLSLAVGRESGRVLTGAFDALSVAALALNAFGRIVAASQAAEALLCEERVIGVRHGRLRGATIAAARALDGVLAPFLTLQRTPPEPAAAELRGNGQTLRIRVSMLPRHRFAAGFSATTLVVIEAPPAPPLTPELAALLTPAELDIATALLRGERPSQIAARRGVSISTVRSQLKVIFAKADVSGQIEFVARARHQPGNAGDGGCSDNGPGGGKR